MTAILLLFMWMEHNWDTSELPVTLLFQWTEHNQGKFELPITRVLWIDRSTGIIRWYKTSAYYWYIYTLVVFPLVAYFGNTSFILSSGLGTALGVYCTYPSFHRIFGLSTNYMHMVYIQLPYMSRCMCIIICIFIYKSLIVLTKPGFGSLSFLKTML